MAITIQHGPDPATVGRAAAYAGAAQFQQRQQQVALNAQQQQQELLLRRQIAEENAMLNRAQYALAYQQAADRSQQQWAGIDLQDAQAEANYYLQQDRLKQQQQAVQQRQAGYEAMNASREKIAGERNQNELDKIELRYSAQQRAEMEKLNQQINHLVQNEGTLYTPEQVEAGLQQIGMQQQRIKKAAGLSIPTKPPANLAQEFGDQTHTDPTTGVQYARASNGSWKVLRDPSRSGLSIGDFAKLLAEERTNLTDRQGNVLPEFRRSRPDGSPMSANEIAVERLRELQGLYQQMANPQGTGPVPGGQQHAPAPGQPGAVPTNPEGVVQVWERQLRQQAGQHAKHPDLTPDLDRQLAAWFLENTGNRAAQGAVTDLRTIIRVYGMDAGDMPADVREQYLDLRQAFGLDKPGQGPAMLPKGNAAFAARADGRRDSESALRPGAKQLREQIDRAKPQGRPTPPGQAAAPAAGQGEPPPGPGRFMQDVEVSQYDQLARKFGEGTPQANAVHGIRIVMNEFGSIDAMPADALQDLKRSLDLVGGELGMGKDKLEAWRAKIRARLARLQAEQRPSAAPPRQAPAPPDPNFDPRYIQGFEGSAYFPG
ncbi:MAG: hypothetical protein JNM56_04935 [Planctomycetia bacterium]|nr:hypothetical protein [Planctomycetia bacterium]